jgi:hypothetical protein
VPRDTRWGVAAALGITEASIFRAVDYDHALRVAGGFPFKDRIYTGLQISGSLASSKYS